MSVEVVSLQVERRRELTLLVELFSLEDDLVPLALDDVA
jgi:hypothetical protein